MSPAHRLDLVLRALTVVFVIAGGAALVVPPAVPEGQRPPPDLAAAAGAAAHAVPPFTDVDEETQAVLDANIFSTTRARPRTRYDPYGSPVDDPAPMAPGYFEPGLAPDDPPEDAVPRFFGTVVGPGGTAALLRLDPSAPDARLYREGESGGGYRVVRIESQAVTLMGPNGSITLRLPPPPGVP